MNNIMMRYGCAAVMVLLAIGCKTVSWNPDAMPMGPDGVRLNRIPGVEPISIPSGVSDALTLDAVEKALAGTEPGSRNNYWKSQWRPEDRDPGNKWIRIALTSRSHALTVCYRIEGDLLLADVPCSRDLKQGRGVIHKKVPAWINNLKPLISAQLYAAANGSSLLGTRFDARNRKTIAEARIAEAEASKAESEAAAASARVDASVPCRFCRWCGEKVTEEANYCSGCGKKLK